MVRITATADWTIALDEGFAVLDAGDAFQAHKDGVVVYVSSVAIESHDGTPPGAEALLVAAARVLRAPERYRCEGPETVGEAQLVEEQDGWRLRGVMCAAGTVATCVIDIPGEGQAEWALAAWGSLEPTSLVP